MSRMACEDGSSSTPGSSTRTNARLSRRSFPDSYLSNLTPTLYSWTAPYRVLTCQISSTISIALFSTLIPLCQQPSSLLRHTIHHFHSHYRRHAVQQHPHCSLQGDHRHRLSTAYVPSRSLFKLATPSNTTLVARVKKIISQDDDINSCSNNAAFVITVATEMFLQHLVEQAHNVVKSERKPRRNIQYRDVGEYTSPRTSYIWIVPLTHVQQTQLLA